ncbi:MAG TPA: phosphatase PAP2 family protein [Gemmatimonadaceae bacterium]|nr:phosphatase PAP2 family protein [Gemmatimonadaceae bacterium]
MISTDTPANVIHDAVASHERPPIVRGDPRSLALGWLAVYLGASAIWLLIGGHVWLVVLHAVGIATARRTVRPRTAWSQFIGDVLPLIAAPALYAEVPMLITATGAAQAGYHDLLIQHWERAIFGMQPAQTLAGLLPLRWLSEALHAGYLSYYAIIFVPPLLLLARGKREAFAETVLAITTACLICWTLFSLFPVQGPRYLWPAPRGIPDGPVRRLTLGILAAGSSRGAAFPSSHMTVSIVQTAMMWRWQRHVAWILIALTLLVGIGAVYGGFHYAADMLAGAVVAAVVIALVRRTSTAPALRRE